MTSFKKWTITVVSSILLLVGVIALTNIVVDANGIFHTDPSSQFQPPNMSYAKVNYLLRNSNKFDSFIFGSSRVGSLDVKKIAAESYYNLFCPGGLPEEHLQHIRFLLKNGIVIRNVMIGLDDFSYQVDHRIHLSDLDLQPHPGVSGKNLFTFYVEYILKLKRLVPQVKAFIGHYRQLRDHSWKAPYIFDLSETGTIICRDCDGGIERNVKEHVSSAKFKDPAEYRIVLEDRIVPTLRSLKEVVDLAKDHNFHVVVFLNPLHKLTYMNADLERFSRFKKSLAEIIPYYDFTGLNSITTDNYYYYETSHYRRLVGDMMLKVMLGTPEVAVPDDFGFLVTPDNIDAHLKSQCRELEKVRNGLNSANASYAASCQRTP